MAITGTHIITQAQHDLNKVLDLDYAEFRWLDYVNDAQRAVALVRPDSTAISTTIDLEAGAEQRLAGARRLLSIAHNIFTVNGSIEKVGDAVGPQVSKKDIDTYEPGWYTERNWGSWVRDYMYNEQNPLVFWVYPGIKSSPELPVDDEAPYPEKAVAVANGVQYINNTTGPLSAEPPGTGWTQVTSVDVSVAVEVSVDPDDLRKEGDNITLEEVYQPALQEWVMYRALVGHKPPMYNEAMLHFRNFFNLLGVKMKSDLAISPRYIDRHEQPEAIASVGGTML